MTAPASAGWGFSDKRPRSCQLPNVGSVMGMAWEDCGNQAGKGDPLSAAINDIATLGVAEESMLGRGH